MLTPPPPKAQHRLGTREGVLPTFEYRFVNPKTGRANKRKRWAYDKDDPVQALKADNIVPLEIEQMPSPAATDRQIDYLKDLIGSVPSGLAVKEASNLIDNALGQRPVADDSDFEVARKLKVEVTKYASKKAIHEAIFYAMEGRSPGDFAAWFAYRVYRNEFDRYSRGIKDPTHEAFRAIGGKIISSDRLLESFKRSAGRSEVHFRWFGNLRTSDGDILCGDGNKTEVYGFVIDELRSRGLLNAKYQKTTTMKGAPSTIHYQGALPPLLGERPPKRRIWPSLLVFVIAMIWILM